MEKKAYIEFVEGLQKDFLYLHANGKCYIFHWTDEDLAELRDRIESMGIEDIEYYGHTVLTEETMSDIKVKQYCLALAERI